MEISLDGLLYGGFGKWDRKKDEFTLFPDFKAFRGSTIDVATGLATDNENGIWVATLGHGLQKFDQVHGKFTEIYVRKEGDPFGPSDISVVSVANINDSLMAIGTKDGGIDLFNRKTRRFDCITTANGLPGNAIAALSFHPPSDLWAATSQGLCKVNLFNHQVTTYGLPDGILSNEFGELVHIGRTRNGKLMAGFKGGFVCFSPDSVAQTQPPNDVSIIGLSVFDQPWPIDSILESHGTVDLSYRQNFISIQYGTLSYLSAEREHYYYQMEGVDRGWVDADKRRTAYYTDLHGGSYLFKVRCENSDGVPCQHIAVLSIYIHPPFWERAWFYALCAAILIFVLNFLYRTRMKEARVKTDLRNAVARDLHDDVGSSLSGINIYSRLALDRMEEGRSAGEPLLQLIHERSEKMMESLSDIVWSLDVKNDTMQSTVAKMKEYAVDMLERQQIACDWEAGKNVYDIRLNPLIRKEFYLIFKEAINNVSKYSKARVVSVRLSAEAGRLILSVQDDGRGFDPQQVRQGNGLGNMQTRARKIRADFRLDSSPGIGTAIRLSIPIP